MDRQVMADLRTAQLVIEEEKGGGDGAAGEDDGAAPDLDRSAGGPGDDAAGMTALEVDALDAGVAVDACAGLASGRQVALLRGLLAAVGAAPEAVTASLAVLDVPGDGPRIQAEGAHPA